MQSAALNAFFDQLCGQVRCDDLQRRYTRRQPLQQLGIAECWVACQKRQDLAITLSPRQPVRLVDGGQDAMRKFGSRRSCAATLFSSSRHAARQMNARLLQPDLRLHGLLQLAIHHVRWTAAPASEQSFNPLSSCDMLTTVPAETTARCHQLPCREGGGLTGGTAAVEQV